MSESKKLQPQSYIYFALAIVPVFFLPTTFDVFNIPKSIVLFPIALASATLYLLQRNRHARISRLNGLFILLIIGISSTSLITETSTARVIFGLPGRGNGLLYYVGVFLLACIASSFIPSNSNDIGRKFLNSLAFPLIVNVAYGWIQFFGLDPVSWNNLINPVIGTVGNPNFSAAVLACSGVFFIYLATAYKKKTRFFWLVISISAFTLSVLTNSIQGPIISLSGVAILIITLTYQRSKKLGIGLLLTSFLSACMMFLAFIGMFGDALRQYTLVLRMEYWKIAVKGILDNPWFGLGPDSYIEAFYRYRTVELVREYSLSLKSDAAHNVILNFGVNFGVFNLALYLILIFFISRNALKNLASQKLSTENLHIQIGSTLWILLLLQSILSIEQIGLSTIQWIIGGFLLNPNFSNLRFSKDSKDTATKLSKKRSNSENRKWGISEFSGEFSFLALAITFFALSPILKEESNLAYLRFAKPDSGISSEEIEKTEQELTFYTRDEYVRSIHLYNFYVLAGRPEEAKAVLESTIRSEPQAMEVYDQLARMSNFEKNYGSEIVFRKIIQTLSPNNANNTLALAEALLATGQDSQALALAKSLSIDFTGLDFADSATAIISKASE